MIKLNTVFFLIAASVMAVVHSLALKLALYWQFLWLDIPMHVLGGTVVALGVFVFYDFGMPLPRRLLRIVPVLSFVIMVALLWEYYELLIGIPVEDDHAVDTTIDLFAGIIGGFLGYAVGTSLRKLA